MRASHSPPTTMRPTTAIASLSLVLAASAAAAPTEVTPSGFLVTHRIESKSAPAAVYEALGHPEKWWNGQHTYSGNAANLRLSLQAGGGFLEEWAGNSVEHAHVLFAMRDKAVRMQGAFGPLQAMAVNAILEFRIEFLPAGSTIAMTYRVRGSPDAALDKLAPVVDRVMVEQAERLAAFVDAKPAPLLPERPAGR